MGKILSVIVVNLNNGAGLERTLASIPLLEWIEVCFIDGGSLDNSLDVASSYSNRLDFFLSEGDSGIYDAMNKGIIAATGKYAIFMNSGDCFSPKLEWARLYSSLLSRSDYIQYGSYSQNKKQFAPKKIKLKYPYSMITSHQSMFFLLSELERRPYDLRFSLGADYELFLRFLSLGHPYFLGFEVANVENYKASRSALIFHEYRQISKNESLMVKLLQCMMRIKHKLS